MALTISTTARNAACDAVVDLVDAGSGAGKLRIYDGTRPAGPGTAVSTQTLLCEVELDDPAFGDSATGAAALAGTPLSGTGVADGTASWFRVVDSDDNAVVDGSAGTSSADLILSTTTISVGLTVQITSGSITMPAG
ncbi:MAG TPA: hypothetical protein VFU47_00340 [Armatimonadota bacterium]|nr:hypothetical protein [Armatimonadota bacterium]